MDEPAVRGSIWGFRQIECGHYVTDAVGPGDLCPFCLDAVETRELHVTAVLRDVSER
jgi:hypothetical protein